MQSTSGQTSPSAFGVPMERIPDNVLFEPIEYIFADHCRQRDMCIALQALAKHSASNDIAPGPAQIILHCLTNDLPLHVADEELDLFPRLTAKAQPGDKFPDILRLLSAEHARDRELLEDTIKGLSEIANGQGLSDPAGFRSAAEVLAAAHLSHLNWENTVVLELARRRLDKDDQREMTKNMAARRGIELPIN